MLRQATHRLAPVLGKATKTDNLPRLFSGLNITLRNNTSSPNATRFIGSTTTSPPPAAFIRRDPVINSLPFRGLLGHTTFDVNNNIILGTSSSSFTSPQTRGFASKKHKRVIKLSKGFRGRANRCFRVAIRRLEKSWQYAYRDRKVKKREFRKLWIQRLNAGVRQQGLSYSRFIEMEGKSGVKLDRKILSGLAMYEPFSFKAVVDVVKKMSANGK